MKIVVLAGGISTEREVSINTGIMVYKALRKKGHDVVFIDVVTGINTLDYKKAFTSEYDFDKEIKEVINNNKKLDNIKSNMTEFFGRGVIENCKEADIVFMALHGESGENGKVQATFDLLGIKYTGSSPLASAIAMDKGITKKILTASGIKMPIGITINKEEFDLSDVLDKVSFPCVVKPCCGGSSVGVYIVETEEKLEEKIREAFKIEDELIIEDYIKGREFSVGVVDNIAYPVIEIIPSEGFYDYVNKYEPGKTLEICPAQINKNLEDAMKELAKKTGEELKLEAYYRVDFLLKNDDINELYVLEANTLPGMTSTSLIPQEAAALNISFEDLCDNLINISMKKYSNVNEGLISFNDIKKACNGTFVGNKELLNSYINGVCIDSRKAEKGFLYVPFKGEKVDGHDYISSAFSNGAILTLSEKDLPDAKFPYIKVESSMKAIQEIAKSYRDTLNVKIIGITGSVGKTSTKEIVAATLSSKYKVLKTEGNYNNEIGLPLTIFKIKKEHQIAVLEMGISDFGEMDLLSSIAKPDICVITNIGACHLETLKNLDGVLKAKTEMFLHMKKDGIILLNGDDPKLRTITKYQGITPAFYGLNDNNDIFANEIKSHGLKGISAKIFDKKNNKRHEVFVNIPGMHMIYNALAAVFIAKYFDMSHEDIEKGLKTLKPVSGRINIINSKNNLTIIDDCYNANPTSMKASIDVLDLANTRKVAILGDMFELGENEKSLHKEIGEHLNLKDIDVLVTIGNLSKHIYSSEKKLSKDNKFYFENIDEFLNNYTSFIKENDTILIKASNSMNFKRIVEALV